jgi:predicted nucleic acid-binding protein
MALYLLDADALIDFITGCRPTIDLLEDLTRVRDDLAVCEVSVAETYAGLRRDATGRLEALLDGCLFLASTAEIARQAGRWRFDYAGQGQPLSTTDVLIAATALAHRATIITGNVRHYPMPEVSLLPLPR